MQRTNMRGLRKSRDVAGQLAVLVGILNQTPKLHQLVGDINTIDEFARGKGYPNHFWAIGALGGAKLRNDIDERFGRVENVFKKYSVTIVPWQPSKRGWTGTYSLTGVGAESVGNIRAGALVIWNAAAAGVLRGVHQCLHCHRWFAARKADQKFCTSTCREKAFRTTDSGRAARAQYMRQYRANFEK